MSNDSQSVEDGGLLIGIEKGWRGMRDCGIGGGYLKLLELKGNKFLQTF